MTIRDRFKVRVAEYVYFDSGRIDPQIPPQISLELAEAILSIKLDDRYRLAIVDDAGELPEPLDCGDIHCQSFCHLAEQKNMLKQNYRREIV